MALTENVTAIGTLLGSATIGFKLIRDYMRNERAKDRGEVSEAVALKNLKLEVDRLSARLEAVEKDLIEKENEVQRVQDQVDEQRRLRRIAEDELAAATRKQLAVEERVRQLERKAE